MWTIKTNVCIHCNIIKQYFVIFLVALHKIEILNHSSEELVLHYSDCDLLIGDREYQEIQAFGQ